MWWTGAVSVAYFGINGNLDSEKSDLCHKIKLPFMPKYAIVCQIYSNHCHFMSFQIWNFIILQFFTFLDTIGCFTSYLDDLKWFPRNKIFLKKKFFSKKKSKIFLCPKKFFPWFWLNSLQIIYNNNYLENYQ